MKLMTAKQASEYLGISTVTFWKMRKNCPIKTVKIGQNSERFDLDTLVKWVADYDPTAAYRNA